MKDDPKQNGDYFSPNVGKGGVSGNASCSSGSGASMCGSGSGPGGPCSSGSNHSW